MENAFDQLEDRVKKAAEVVKRLRYENKTLQDELGRIRPRLQEVEKTVQALEKGKGASAEETRRLEALAGEIKDLRAEREEIRRRIAKLVQVLDALDPEEEDPLMAAEKPNLVHVEIFGQSYALSAGADAGYVEQLAAHVDAQMREVGKAAGAVDSLRVAVLAALNIADECFRLRDGKDGALGEARRRAASLARDLDAVLRE